MLLASSRASRLRFRKVSIRPFAKTTGQIPSMADYLNTEKSRYPTKTSSPNDGVNSPLGQVPTSSAALKREATESRIKVLVTEIDSLRTALRSATEESAMLKSRLQEAEKAVVSAREEHEKLQQGFAEAKSEIEKLTRSGIQGKGTKKSSGGIDELPDPESEELVAWRLRSQDLEQELDDLKRDYQQMETDWSNRLVEEQGNRALPIVMVATCVALTVGAGSVYAVNHYHHKDRLKMCERQLEFENRIASLDRAYTETLADLAATEKALESANAEVVRLQQPLQKGDQNSAWWNSLKFW